MALIDDETCCGGDCGEGNEPVNIIGGKGDDGWTALHSDIASKSHFTIIPPLDASVGEQAQVVKVARKIVAWVDGSGTPPVLPAPPDNFLGVNGNYTSFINAINYKGPAGPAGEGTDVDREADDFSEAVQAGDEADGVFFAIEKIANKFSLTARFIRWIKARIAAVPRSVVAAGSNTTVSSVTVGNTTTYTVNSSGGGVTTTPGGAVTQVQFHDTGGVFAGDDGMNYDKNANRLAVSNLRITAAPTNAPTNLNFLVRNQVDGAVEQRVDLPVVVNSVDSVGSVITKTLSHFFGTSGQIIHTLDYAIYEDAPGMDSVAKTPTSPGIAGLVSYNSGFLYVCVADNTWVRHAVTTSW